MNIYPANEQQISEVERGRRCETVVPIPVGSSLVAGDTVLFALSQSRPGQQPCFVKGGDSVLVSLTGVVDTGASDPLTGQTLFRLTWKPLGQERADTVMQRAGKSRKSHRTI